MDSLRKNNKLLLVMLFALVIVLIALAVSIFSYSRAGTVGNKVTVGKLELTLTEGNAITLTDTYPMTDDDGKKLSGFTFSLKNTGTSNASYSIYLDDVSVDSGNTRLADKNIRCMLTKNTVVGTVKNLSDLVVNSKKVIDSGTINSNTTISYNFKLWVSGTAEGDVSGQAWKGKLRITGEQVH